MNSFRQAVLVPRELIEAAPEILPAIIKGAQKAGIDWAEMVAGMGSGLADQGRHGDTELAHVNPQEGAMLETMGGSGTINPGTGLREYYQDDDSRGRADTSSGGGNERSGGTNTGGVSRMPSTAAPPSSGPGGPGYTGVAESGGGGTAPGVTITRTPGAGRVLPAGADPMAREVREGATPYDIVPKVSAPHLSGLATGEIGQGDIAPTGSERTVGYWYSPTDVTTGGIAGAILGSLAPGIGGAAVGGKIGNKYGDKVFTLPGGYVDMTASIEGRDPGGAGDAGPLRGGFPTETFVPEGLKQWIRPALRTPAERFGFETGMNPLQQRVSLATRGTSGLDSFYRGKEAMDYYQNLLQRALITDSGELGSLNELRPIEHQYLGMMGVPSRTTTEGLLEALAAA